MAKGAKRNDAQALLDQVRSIVNASGKPSSPVAASRGPKLFGGAVALSTTEVRPVLAAFDSCTSFSGLGRALKEYCQRALMMFELGIESGAAFSGAWDAVVMSQCPEKMLELQPLGKLFHAIHAQLSAAEKKYLELVEAANGKPDISRPLSDLRHLLTSTSESLTQLLAASKRGVDIEALAFEPGAVRRIVAEGKEMTQLSNQAVPEIKALNSEQKSELDVQYGAITSKLNRLGAELQSKALLHSQKAAALSSSASAAGDHQPENSPRVSADVAAAAKSSDGQLVPTPPAAGNSTKSLPVSARQNLSLELPDQVARTPGQLRLMKYVNESPQPQSARAPVRNLQPLELTRARQEVEKLEWATPISAAQRFGAELKRLREEVFGEQPTITDSRAGPLKLIVQSADSYVHSGVQTDRPTEGRLSQSHPLLNALATM